MADDGAVSVYVVAIISAFIILLSPFYYLRNTILDKVYAVLFIYIGTITIASLYSENGGILFVILFLIAPFILLSAGIRSILAKKNRNILLGITLLVLGLLPVCMEAASQISKGDYEGRKQAHIECEQVLWEIDRAADIYESKNNKYTDDLRVLSGYLSGEKYGNVKNGIYDALTGRIYKSCDDFKIVLIDNGKSFEMTARPKQSNSCLICFTPLGGRCEKKHEYSTTWLDGCP